MTSLGLFKDTFGLLKKNFMIFFTLALAGQVIVTILGFAIGGSAALGAGNTENIDPSALVGSIALATFISTFAGQVVSAVLHLAAWDVMQNAPIRIKDYVRKSLFVVVTIVALSLIVSLAVGFGSVLFIIPGIYIGAALSVVVPAIVIGNAGWGAIGESWALTKERRWTIAGGFILVLLVVLLIGFIFGVIGTIIGLNLITDIVSGAIGLAIIAIFATLVYGRVTHDMGVNPTALGPDD